MNRGKEIYGKLSSLPIYSYGSPTGEERKKETERLYIWSIMDENFPNFMKYIKIYI